jgi:type IV secretory pathway VirB6-like protein
MFLIALSSIALAVLLALGPLFIPMLFFDATRRFFSAWIAQLANYGLITILTVMLSALLLQIVQSYASQTAARGAAIVTVDALNMILVAVLVFLILRQVMPIAAALAGGLSLSSFGLLSRTLNLGLKGGFVAAKPAAKYGLPLAVRGAAAAPSTVGRAMVIAALAGQYVYRRAGAGINGLGRGWRIRGR